MNYKKYIKEKDSKKYLELRIPKSRFKEKPSEVQTTETKKPQ